MPKKIKEELINLRPELQDFQTYFESEIEEKYDDLLEQGAKNKRWFLMTAIPSITLFPLFLWIVLGYFNMPLGSWITWILIAVYPILAWFLSVFMLMDTKAEMKSLLTSKLYDYFELSRQPGGNSNEMVAPFRRHDLVPRHNERKTDDWIEGTVGETPFEFVECKLVKVTKTKNHQNSYRTTKTRRTIYSGFLLRLQIDNVLDGEFLLRKRRGIIEKLFGLSGSDNDGKKIELGTTSLGRGYDAWSNGDDLAQKAISQFLPRLVKALEPLKPKSINCKKVGNSIYIAAECRDLFEPKVFFASMRDGNQLETAIRELAAILDVVDSGKAFEPV